MNCLNRSRRIAHPLALRTSAGNQLNTVRGFFFAIVASAAFAPMQAQTPPIFRVPDSPSCSKCKIVQTTLATVGQPTDSIRLRGRPAIATIDGRGRYWIVEGINPPLLFDHSGKFLQQVGQKGRKLGEFLAPSAIVALPGDSILVLDAALRGTVFASSLVPARSIVVPAPLHPVAILRWPILIANGPRPTSGGVGWPLHRMSLAKDTAEILDSFGPGNGSISPETTLDGTQLVAPSRTSGAWSIDQVQYRLNRWNVDGSREFSIERRPAWFAEPTHHGIGSPTTPPPPSVAGIVEDAAGLVWIFVNVPSGSWQSAWPVIPQGTKEISTGLIMFDKLYHTVVEVIDPAIRRVVARKTLAVWVVTALPGAQALVFASDEHAAATTKIVKFTLSRN
jgi:hypothetical protein